MLIYITFAFITFVSSFFGLLWLHQKRQAAEIQSEDMFWYMSLSVMGGLLFPLYFISVALFFSGKLFVKQLNKSLTKTEI